MYPQQYPATTTSAPPPYSYNSFQQMNTRVDDDERLRKYEYLVNRYEINRDFATRLRKLEGYEIVFIVDGK